MGQKTQKKSDNILRYKQVRLSFCTPQFTDNKKFNFTVSWLEQTWSQPMNTLSDMYILYSILVASMHNGARVGARICVNIHQTPNQKNLSRSQLQI